MIDENEVLIRLAMKESGLVAAQGLPKNVRQSIIDKVKEKMLNRVGDLAVAEVSNVDLDSIDLNEAITEKNYDQVAGFIVQIAQEAENEIGKNVDESDANNSDEDFDDEESDENFDDEDFGDEESDDSDDVNPKSIIKLFDKMLDVVKVLVDSTPPMKIASLTGFDIDRLADRYIEMAHGIVSRTAIWHRTRKKDTKGLTVWKWPEREYTIYRRKRNKPETDPTPKEIDKAKRMLDKKWPQKPVEVKAPEKMPEKPLDERKVEPPKPEKPKLEAPKIEEPKPEKPKIEEPKPEKPKPDIPKLEESEKPKLEIPKTEEAPESEESQSDESESEPPELPETEDSDEPPDLPKTQKPKMKVPDLDKFNIDDDDDDDLDEFLRDESSWMGRGLGKGLEKDVPVPEWYDPNNKLDPSNVSDMHKKGFKRGAVNIQNNTVFYDITTGEGHRFSDLSSDMQEKIRDLNNSSRIWLFPPHMVISKPAGVGSKSKKHSLAKLSHDVFKKVFHSIGDTVRSAKKPKELIHSLSKIMKDHKADLNGLTDYVKKSLSRKVDIKVPGTIRSSLASLFDGFLKNITSGGGIELPKPHAVAASSDLVDRVAAYVVADRIMFSVKDKDLMRDTGGKTKKRQREPYDKPPRNDLRVRYRKRELTKDELDKDNDLDPDMKG